MCGYTMVEKIRNEVTKDIYKVAPIENKRKEIRFRWLDHVKRRSVDAHVRND